LAREKLQLRSALPREKGNDDSRLKIWHIDASEVGNSSVLNEIPTQTPNPAFSSEVEAWLKMATRFVESASGDADHQPPWVGSANALKRPGGTLPGGRRFAVLSTLPKHLRLPPKKDLQPSRHQQKPTKAAGTANATPKARQAAAVLPPVTPLPSPVLLPDPAARQLGFNCPSCFAVLIIKDPSTYDGRPAPCPTCGIRILPPQCFPDSPFSIVYRSGAPVPPPYPQLPG
jgi:hypothetical protein